MTTKTIRGELQKALGTGGRPRIRMTTDQLDSQNDRVIQEGLTIRERLRVMFAHQYDAFPMGQVVAIHRGAHYTDAEFEWFSGDPLIDRVRNIYEQGGFDASIGMRVHEAVPNDHNGYDIRSANVIEVSLTAVPANEGAVALAKSLNGYALSRRDKKVSCPRAADCPNVTNTINCPAERDCPLIGHAISASYASRGTVLELDDDVVLQIEPVLSDAEVRARLPRLVERHLAPEIEKAVRDAMTMLTGRVD